MNYLRRLLTLLLKWLAGNTTVADQELRIIEQNVYTMINNICLSTDMKTLYLIDDGRAIGFPLDERSGILIGALQGQLTVATAFELPRPLETATPELETGSRATTLVLQATKNKEMVRLSTQKTVWSSVFHKDRLQLSFVGATEVEIRRPGEEPVDYKAEEVSFDLIENTLNVRRIGETIVIRCLPNKIERQ